MKHPLVNGPFGRIDIPDVSFGNTSSMDLFNINEMVLFDFYNRNRKLYSKVLDLGANIGLHSVIMARCGWEVRAFEPDPEHIRLFKQITQTNDVMLDLHEAAIFLHDKEAMNLTRVLGNTTGNHLTGCKSPYGNLEQIIVKAEGARSHFEWADFVKMDIEGAEGNILCSLGLDIWQTTDCMAEIGSEETAKNIYKYFYSRVKMYAQKIGWRRVNYIKDMPHHHAEGSLFITLRDAVP